jgi:hypothetical protein
VVKSVKIKSNKIKQVEPLGAKYSRRKVRYSHKHEQYRTAVKKDNINNEIRRTE